jgi:hypothetical protein
VPFGGLFAGDLEGGLPYWLAESGRRSGTECAVALTSSGRWEVADLWHALRST